MYRVVICLISFVFLSMVNISWAQTYYVDNADGNDQYSGTSPATPWKSLAKVSSTNFAPGDSILLKKDEVWSESLTVSSSGSQGNPILYGAYGDGDNPVIKLTTSFEDWVLETSSGSKKIWKGTIANNKNAHSAAWNGVRVPAYLGYEDSDVWWDAPDSLLDMRNNYYYSPLNSNVFYFRNDSGNPGIMEIAHREFGIKVDGKQYVVIGGIDVFGPGGLQIDVSNCKYVTVKNLTASNSAYRGCMIKSNSENCVFENMKAFNHRSTGIYINNAGANNVIKNCESYANGFLPTDSGDQGCFGIESSPNNTIQDCYAHDNGHEGVEHIDAAISVYESPNCSVKRCLVENSADKAIMFAGDTSDCVAAYNVIDGWGVYGDSITAWPSVDGLRIGGGETAARIFNTKILNNLFINGGKTIKSGYAALRIQYRENAGTIVANNIFYNNSGNLEVNAQSRDGFSDWQFSNNLYYRDSGETISWSGKSYAYNRIVGKTSGYFTYDQGQGEGSIMGDPKLASNKMDLLSDSPCIDAGIDVGESLDFHGRPVPAGKKVDIGPFEYQGGAYIQPPQGLQIDATTSE